MYILHIIYMYMYMFVYTCININIVHRGKYEHILLEYVEPSWTLAVEAEILRSLTGRLS